MSKHQEHYILISVIPELSRINNSRMWRLIWYCVTDNTEWEMIVDESYANFRRSHWDRIVESDQPWGLYTNLKRTDRVTRSGSRILNADSRPECIGTTTEEDAVSTALDLKNSKLPQLTDLFQVDA